MLKADGYDAALWGYAGEADIAPVDEAQIAAAPRVLVMPFSASQEEIVQALYFLCAGSACFGGYACDAALTLAGKRGVAYYNLMDDEPFAILNCIPTAEGALELAMQHTPYTLHGAKAAVLGFGRVGKTTARLFHACSCDTTVVCRSYEQLAYAQAYGYNTAHLSKLGLVLRDTDILLNTVPERLLDKEMLSNLK
jgi:dipicolinate synthase subunit A